jgi:hypothetical protein
VGLEQGPLSLVRITKELLEWKSSGSGSRKPRLTAVGIRYADRATPSIRKSWRQLRLTSGGRSVGIVRLPSEATEISFLFSWHHNTLILNVEWPKFNFITLWPAKC